VLTRPDPDRRLSSVRRSRLILLLLLPVALLAGCSGSSHAASSSGSSSSSSSSLAGVTVTGAAGQTPTLKLAKTPFSVTSTVTKVVTPGTGPTIAKGQRVRVDYLLVNGRTDKAADSTFGKTSVVFTADPAQLLPGLADGLINQKVGSRMLLAVPPKDAFGTTGNTQLGVQKDDTLLFVLDLKSATTPIAKPTGTVVPAKKGQPTVKVDAKGTPSITMPAGAAPTKLVAQDLIAGKGAVVKAGQTISVNYVGAIWPGGKVFDSSYARGTLSDTVIGEGEVIKGWDQGLVGQRVGSRVLLVIPPDLGYGTSGNTSAGIKGSDTLVFVVDVLDAT
jgi:peptidylprolyl isomerase